MKPDWLRLPLLLAASALLLAMAPSFALAAAPASPIPAAGQPAAAAGCAANSGVPQHPALLPEPPHVVREYVVVGETSTGTTFNDVFGATYCIDANTAIKVDDAPAIHQRGLSVVTVIQGSLIVTLVGKCAVINCMTAAGGARIGHVETTNQVTWTDLAIGATAILLPGDTAILDDVVINAASGPEQTIVATTSTVQNNPGSGCLAACWQFG